MGRPKRAYTTRRDYYNRRLWFRNLCVVLYAYECCNVPCPSSSVCSRLCPVMVSVTVAVSGLGACDLGVRGKPSAGPRARPRERERDHWGKERRPSADTRRRSLTGASPTGSWALAFLALALAAAGACFWSTQGSCDLITQHAIPAAIQNLPPTPAASLSPPPPRAQWPPTHHRQRPPSQAHTAAMSTFTTPACSSPTLSHSLASPDS